MTDAVRRWYARELGWPTTGSAPVELLTGVRFDVLELPADAGCAVLRRVPRTGPVAVEGRRMRLLVAAGSADELPGLLDWLEWGGIPLDLTALGSGGRMAAPVPPGTWGPRSQSAAFWVRPPEPGCDVESALPTTCFRQGRREGVGGDGGAPDLVRLVGVAATECHRARLLGAQRRQALAFSYASRTVAGTRPRSLTS
ncbi:SCO3374 family protein [Streptomyces sp. XD-27]|uniref:SCO3374 family protein n=1 Tax=Streptomyces sp. XD-27 TaxID=3062779 RepID=UPI0026F45DA8|nr:SCO3374 family protein [Streptomyces sp. XD-27]WKX71812.1 SCO3374 family protein [Streptomyces sp. XD-27]